MSRRLPEGGRLVDRNQPLAFFWNNRKLPGLKGDTVASALLANGQTLVGRSFKYHRPRGIMTSGPEEPNALVEVGTGTARQPNRRATTVTLSEGMRCRSQNHWPSLEFDLGAVSGFLSPFLAAGFYYKTFIFPRFGWKHVFEPLIRRAAGLGKPPAGRDPETYEHQYAHTDVLVVGGGLAGLIAAETAAETGARVLLLEQSSRFGGRSPIDGTLIDSRGADEWVAEKISSFTRNPRVAIHGRTTVLGVYDHGYVLAREHLTEGSTDSGLPAQRLWRIRARKIVMATGAIERPLVFAGNDIPGVMLASSVRDYAVNYGVCVGDRVVVVTNNDNAYLTAGFLIRAGVDVPAVVDTRSAANGAAVAAANAAGIRVVRGASLSRVFGTRQVRGVAVFRTGGESVERIPCDAVAMSGGWSPAVHIWSHCGGKLRWDPDWSCFCPDPNAPPTGADGSELVIPCGSARGIMNPAEIVADAESAGREAARLAGFTPGEDPHGESVAPLVSAAPEDPPESSWILPGKAVQDIRSWAFLDFQNDVKVSDIELAAREGFESVEHAKRYTTLGMATDQGKLSNINGLAVLADCVGRDIPDVGTTTFRPPYVPVNFGAIAGEARGPLFKPTRKTSIDSWHDDNGAHWEPVADWRRPFCYPGDRESIEDAVNREILNTRQRVGLLDASTLGKILVKGPDAPRFMDMMYTGMMSSLKPGKCRYGLMCSDNGFLIDDGVVARLSEDSFLCHTTSGGSDRIHMWMEEWLQTEWWTWKVWTLNLTEHYAQIGVVGPRAGTVLEGLGGIDVTDEALPFMSFVSGQLGNVPARIFRISFSGELSYEIQVPASRGMVLWKQLLREGKPHGIMPYGTEALHVMRAEKGFIMIGDETDGTVTPQDLGLHWAVSRKKDDFLGMRAQARPFLTDPDRWQYVGLEALDPERPLPDGAYATDGTKGPDGFANMIGRVTSTYWSPTLKRPIALGLVQRGPERMGEVISFQPAGGKPIQARIVDPRFLP